MIEQKNRQLGWMGAASFGVAGTINFFNLGPVLNIVGNFGVVLFIIGMLIALITGYGWLKLVLCYPDKVGGAAVNSFEYFKSRSPLLLTILCFANWASWVAQAALSAIFCATAITQWLSLDTIPPTYLAVLILFGLTGIGLTSLTTAARFTICAAVIAVTLAIFSAVLPLLFGNIHISSDEIINVQVPFAGWFGYFTAIMSGFYLVGWIVPAYEVTTWLTGEMREPKKNLPRAFISTGLVSSLTFMLLPIIWLSTLGYSQLVSDYTSGTNWLFFNQLFPGFGPTFSSICGFLFIVSYMICSGIGSLVGPSRMLVQLSEYGLFPSIYQKRLPNGAPWIAVTTMGLIAIVVVVAGTPLWLIAATNFGYLACMILASIGAWILSRNRPLIASAPWIIAGMLLSLVWLGSIIFGFQQYGITSIIGGIAFILLGALPYLIRKMNDLKLQNKRINVYSIHIALPSILFLLMVLNTSGFLLMLLNLPQHSLGLDVLLQDIFVSIILITITVALWVTDSVAHAAVNVANASRQLSQVTMPQMAKAMQDLGAGLVDKIHLTSHKKFISPSERKDELGIMTNNFSDLELQVENVFISIIAAKNQLAESREKILQMNAELEKRVIERTTELEKTQKQLVLTARQAGMSEVATSILHNIGNILNSVKVTLTLLQESSEKSDFDNMVKIADLMKQNIGHLTKYLSDDPKGKLLPQYLIVLIESISKENAKIKNEIADLKQHVNHIEDIVAMQNAISGVSSVMTKIFLPDAIDAAIKMCGGSLEKRNIKLKKEFQENIFVETDEAKFIQILINLIKNAQDSLSSTENNLEKLITIKMHKTDNNRINIEVHDNGIGISSENIAKVFAMGFTTKTHGHGFGLHSSAIAAKEMGGSLQAVSEGIGKGAIFILSLPIVKKDHFTKNKEVEHDTGK